MLTVSKRSSPNSVQCGLCISRKTCRLRLCSRLSINGWKQKDFPLHFVFHIPSISEEYGWADGSVRSLAIPLPSSPNIIKSGALLCLAQLLNAKDPFLRMSLPAGPNRLDRFGGIFPARSEDVRSNWQVDPGRPSRLPMERVRHRHRIFALLAILFVAPSVRSQRPWMPEQSSAADFDQRMGSVKQRHHEIRSPVWQTVSRPKRSVVQRKYAKPADFCSEIESGFAEFHHFILAHRKSFLGFVQTFAQTKSSASLIHQLYGRLLQNL